VLSRRQRRQTGWRRGERLAIQLSNIFNIILLGAKVFASVQSRSLAIIASTLDSLLDCLSGFILWYTARSMQTQNPYKYPIGKKRMQPLVRTPRTPSITLPACAYHNISLLLRHHLFAWPALFAVTGPCRENSALSRLSKGVLAAAFLIRLHCPCFRGSLYSRALWPCWASRFSPRPCASCLSR